MGLADATVLEVGTHGLSYADDGVTLFGGTAFEVGVEEVDDGGVSRVKGETVDGVDDGGGFFTPGGGAADDAGFTGMGVNDIGLEMADESAETTVAKVIMRRQDGAAHGGFFVERSS